ncbi:MAG: hypothetical protein ABI462_14600 [Ignavibacteria bacterium]
MLKKILLIIFPLLWTTLICSQEKISSEPMPYAEGSTSNFEVVITYNNIEPNKEATLTFYISDFKTNAPIDNAKLEIDIPGIDRSKINILPYVDPGIYEALITFPEIKKYTFLMSITSGEINDLVVINDVDIGMKEDVVSKEKESKSVITIIHENLLLIIISVLIVILIAFIFYRIGKKSSIAKLNSDSKNIINEIEL